MLFSFENPPGTRIITGSQDSIGIVFPGLNRIDYAGDYWPVKITSIHDENILSWLERHLYLVTLGPRIHQYDVLENTVINKENAESLSFAAAQCWEALLEKNLEKFGEHFRKSFEAQIRMFPKMVLDDVFRAIDHYKDSAFGWKLSGAGGGGYLIFVSPKPIKGTLQIKIRRKIQEYGRLHADYSEA